MLDSFDMLDNEHFEARGFPVVVDQQGVGPVTLEGPAFSGTSMLPPVEEPAPWLGEHTHQICTEVLGLDDAEVERLVKEGVLEVTPEDKRPG
jgi:benzylsuccinate CoA-transferase BbsF subunit